MTRKQAVWTFSVGAALQLLGAIALLVRLGAL